MLTWIKNLIKNNNTEILDWKTDSSIYKFLKENLDEDGKLKDSANDLPDEKAIDENGVRFAPGLFDSILGPQENKESKGKTNDLTKLIIRIAEYGDVKSKSKFFQTITESDSVIGIIDDFLENVMKISPPVYPYLIEFAKDLAFETSDRNAVKVGIAILGVCGEKNYIDKVKVIGLHDEFTLFSIVAILNTSDNKVDDLWEIAKKVDGWGKIHTVERLTKLELPINIKEWLITDGYKNSIMYEYLAYTCAIHGNLQDKIIADTISNEIFKSSGEIIKALITGGPAEDISHYENASILISNYIRHAQTHVADILDFNILHQIKDFLTELQTDISNYAKNGWTEDLISNCIIDIVFILDKNNWTKLAIAALKSDDNLIYWNGKKAAKILHIDIWDIVWSKLKNNPTDSWMWYDVVNEAKANNVDEVIQFAINALPLKEIATGPRDSLGMGPEFIKHQCLDYVVTFLETYPGKGEPILLAALLSPMTRNRNMALKVLQKWGKVNWSEMIFTKLQQLSRIEPNKSTSMNISRLIKGEELS